MSKWVHIRDALCVGSCSLCSLSHSPTQVHTHTHMHKTCCRFARVCPRWSATSMASKKQQKQQQQQSGQVLMVSLINGVIGWALQKAHKNKIESWLCVLIALKRIVDSTEKNRLGNQCKIRFFLLLLFAKPVAEMNFLISQINWEQKQLKIHAIVAGACASAFHSTPYWIAHQSGCGAQLIAHLYIAEWSFTSRKKTVAS